jgi:glyoxylase-like metal-dependent hydrolase (beta-lactamase superfamily II)
VVEGDTIRVGRHCFAVLHTPGHSPDHISLWHEPSRAAFTGDLLIPGGSVMIDWDRGGDMADYLASLARLLKIQPLTLYPAHGPIVAAPVPELTRYIAHRLERERQVADALRSGRTTVPAIADSIYDGLESALVPAARRTIRAHLEKLKAEGRAVNEDDQWGLA